MMRSLAIPINMAPEADTRASTWNSAPWMPFAFEVAVGHQRGEQHGRAMRMLKSTLKPSITTAWAT